VKRYLVFAAFLVTFCACDWTRQYWRLQRALDRQLVADAANPMHAAPEVLVEIRGVDGEMLYRSPALGEGVIAGPVSAREGIGTSAVSDRLHDGTPIRRFSRRADVAGKPAVIRVARSEVPMRRQLRNLAWVIFALLAVALVVAAALAHSLPASFHRDYPLQ
jgi:hypothetical protein